MQIRLEAPDLPGSSVLREYEELAQLQFTSARRRFTNVIRDAAGNYFCLTKGADSTINEFIRPEDAEVQKKSDAQILDYAKDGSRTLVLAYKPISKQDYEQFAQAYLEATTSMEDRDDKIEACFNNPKSLGYEYPAFEENMVLLGATAVEDQLQLEVAETISAFKEANITVMVLTGDKRETAVTIARQSGILDPTSAPMQVSSKDAEGQIDEKQAISQLTRRWEQLKELDADMLIDLVIDGDALEINLNKNADQFMDIFERCKTIVCCRANPFQKAQVV